MAQTRARGARRARVGAGGGARGAAVLGVIAANNTTAPASAVAVGLVRAAVEGGLDGGGLTAEQQQQLFLAQLERERDTIRIANLRHQPAWRQSNGRRPQPKEERRKFTKRNLRQCEPGVGIMGW